MVEMDAVQGRVIVAINHYFYLLIGAKQQFKKPIFKHLNGKITVSLTPNFPSSEFGYVKCI